MRQDEEEIKRKKRKKEGGVQELILLLKIAREDVTIYSFQLLQGQEKSTDAVTEGFIRKVHISRDIYVNT